MGCKLLSVGNIQINYILSKFVLGYIYSCRVPAAVDQKQSDCDFENIFFTFSVFIWNAYQSVWKGKNKCSCRFSKLERLGILAKISEDAIAQKMYRWIK